MVECEYAGFKDFKVFTLPLKTLQVCFISIQISQNSPAQTPINQRFIAYVSFYSIHKPPQSIEMRIEKILPLPRGMLPGCKLERCRRLMNGGSKVQLSLVKMSPIQNSFADFKSQPDLLFSFDAAFFMDLAEYLV